MDFEKNILELKKLVPMKDTLDINDIVIFVLPDMSVYGVVTNIEIDKNKKDEWWHVTFIILSVPVKRYTLTLRPEQMTGKEIFTIEGKQHFFSAVNIKIDNEIDVEFKDKSKDKKVTKLKLVKKDNK